MWNYTFNSSSSYLAFTRLGSLGDGLSYSSRKSVWPMSRNQVKVACTIYYTELWQLWPVGVSIRFIVTVPLLSSHLGGTIFSPILNPLQCGKDLCTSIKSVKYTLAHTAGSFATIQGLHIELHVKEEGRFCRVVESTVFLHDCFGERLFKVSIWLSITRWLGFVIYPSLI